MFNVTWQYLILSNILRNSPFYSTGTLNSFGSFSIEKSSFVKSFSTLYYSSCKFVKFQAKNSLFQQFLSNSLYFDKIEHSNAALESRRLCFIIGPIDISFCIFRLCLNTKEIFGGSIFCLANLSLYQCLFENNAAKRAGSVYCTGKLDIKSVTFDGGYSQEGQGFIHEDCKDMNLSLELVTFVNLESYDHTCFIQNSPGKVRLLHNNFSTNVAENKNAGCFICYADVLVETCILFELNAFSETSFLLINCEQSQFDMVVFYLLHSSKNSFNGSTCLSFYNSENVCLMNRCSFLLCSPGGSQLVKADERASIQLEELCTTSSQIEVIGDGQNIIIDKKNEFNENCRERLIIRLNEPFGFHTQNDDYDLATIRSDIYDGVIIGVFTIFEICIIAVIVYIALYGITKKL